MAGPNPYSPHPSRPKLRVRLDDDGPYVDLGISYSELIIGILDTLENVCCDTGTKLSLSLQLALNKLDVHRGGKP
jgi:hypothetical protein